MNERINIKNIVVKLLARWHYFLIAAVIIFPLAYVYVKYADKVYSIQASLLLKSEEKNNLGGQEFLKGMGLFQSNTELEDEIGILKSYSLIETAIKRLDFGVSYFLDQPFKDIETYSNPPFTIVLDSTISQMVNVPIHIVRTSAKDYRIIAERKHPEVYDFITGSKEQTYQLVDINYRAENGKPFRYQYLGFTLYFEQPWDSLSDEKYYFVINDLDAVVESYQNNLSVAPISRESNIVTLSLPGTEPDKTIRFMNKLMEVYLTNELYKKNQLGLRTIEFIDSQISGVTDSLKQVEGSLESFRVKSNIQDISSAAETLSKNLNDLETQKAGVEIKVKYYTYISNTLKEERLDDIVAPSTFGLEDPLLSSLLIELSRLNQERAGLNYNAKDRNPLAEVIELKIRNTKQTLSENVKNILNVSSIALNDLDRRINKIQGQLNRLPRNERELVNIQRKFNFSDNVYNYLLEKRAEAGIAIASNTVEKSVVDAAKVRGGGPVSPNHKIVYSLALLLSLGGPIVLLIIKDLWNEHLTTQEDVESVTSIPFIGTIVHGSHREKSNGIEHKKCSFTESFQSLRINLQYLTLGQEKSVIGFTSSQPQEGKTFCAVNLASTIAQSGKKTILIDGDMRRPSVSKYLNSENTKGLSNYLVGTSSLDEIITPTRTKGFHVISSGPVPPNPLNLIGLPKMGQLINALRERYEIIIIDAPPIGYVAEYIIFMKYTDANIYVVRSEYTSRYHLSKINRLFEDKKINNLSILLNDVRNRGLNGYSYYGKSYGTAGKS